MTRTISIVLILAIALQTVGCSTWRPLAPVNEIPESDGQASMRNQVLGKLKEGMVVRITIREGATVSMKGQVIECVIEKVRLTSLSATPLMGYAIGNDETEFMLQYADIASIEIRSVRYRGSYFFLGGVAIGTILGFLIPAIGFATAD